MVSEHERRAVRGRLAEGAVELHLAEEANKRRAWREHEVAEAGGGDADADVLARARRLQAERRAERVHQLQNGPEGGQAEREGEREDAAGEEEEGGRHF